MFGVDSQPLPEGPVGFPPTPYHQRDATQVPPDFQADRVRLGGPTTLAQPPVHVGARQAKAQALVGEVDGLPPAPGGSLMLNFYCRPDECSILSKHLSSLAALCAQ